MDFWKDIFAPVLIGLIVGLIGYLALNFLGRDIVAFRVMRREALAEMDRTANVYGRDGGEERWEDAVNSLRSLSTRMSALQVTSNFLVGLYFKWNRYDLGKAATGLMGLSNSLGAADWQRAMHRFSVEKALKFPHQTSAELIREMRSAALARQS